MQRLALPFTPRRPRARARRCDARSPACPIAPLAHPESVVGCRLAAPAQHPTSCSASGPKAYTWPTLTDSSRPSVRLTYEKKAEEGVDGGLDCGHPPARAIFFVARFLLFRFFSLAFFSTLEVAPAGRGAGLTDKLINQSKNCVRVVVSSAERSLSSVTRSRMHRTIRPCVDAPSVA